MAEHYKNLSLENIIEEIDGVVHTEEWRLIKGYEGLYEISSFGRCRSMPKTWESKKGLIVKRKLQIKKGRISHRYIRLTLSKNSKMKSFQAHRLVAAAFIPNIELKPHVNHLLGDRSDNRYFMLEWATRSEDELHSYRVLGKTPSDNWKKNFIGQTSKKIICLETGVNYKSIAEAAQKMKLSRRSINKVCLGSRNHTGGYSFKYI